MSGGKRRRATPFRLRRTPALMLAAVVALPLFTSASGEGLAGSTEASPESSLESGQAGQVGGDRLDELAAAMVGRAEVQAAVMLQTEEPPVLLEALPKDAQVEISSPKGKRVWTASALADHDLPLAAKQAYARAARNSARTDPGCHISWTLLAAIGRVESNHGRYGGSELGTDGVSRPHILGLPLNGVGPVAAISDTDGGRLDGDTVWDRAVGPMQFIPSTWEMSGRDGDGDGTASPHDIDDAATAAASYLCAGGGDLREPEAQKAAIYRYNHSDYYVSLVRAFEAGYRTGDFSVPAPPEVQEEARAKARKADERDAKKAAKAKKAKKRADKAAKAAKRKKARKPGPSASPSKSPSASPSGKPKGKPKGKPSKTPSKSPSKSPGRPPGGKPGTGSPAPSPAPHEVKGVFTECGPDFCLGGKVLDLGTAAQLGQMAAGDFDRDGTPEPNGLELDGLLDAPEVTMVVEPVADGKLGILSINGVPLD